MKNRYSVRLFLPPALALGCLFMGSSSFADMDETLGLDSESAPLICPESHSAHAPFLRPDLAYSVTGVDCFGNPVGGAKTSEIDDLDAESREPASGMAECPDRPHSHARQLRPDLAYAASKRDCQGDPPGESFKALFEPDEVLRNP